MVHLNTTRRQGTILPFLAVTVVALFGLIALGIDVGLMSVARTEAQDIADLAALAGTRQFNGDTTNGSNLNNWSTATSTASTQAGKNKIFKDPSNSTRGVAPTTTTTVKGVYRYDSSVSPPRFVEKMETDAGFSQGSDAWSVLKTSVTFTMPTYFGRVMGINTYSAGATATAAHRPRDVALILDFSGSMRFGCESAFYQDGSSDVRGSLNPDAVYPMFGHYYSISQRTLTTTSTTNTPSANGTSYNPMRRTAAFVDSGGETHAANNLTTSTAGGPAIVQDFISDSTGTRLNAFYNPQSGTYNPNQTPTAMPAPTNFQDQSDSPTTYVGDKFPRMSKATSGTNWVATLKEYWFGNTTVLSNSHTRNSGIGAAPLWEYDNSVTGSTKANSGYGSTFKGYSMGPAYYGKTFFIWPPDPRYDSAANTSSISSSDPKLDTSGNYMCDWRKRFFTYPSSSTRMDDNSRLFNSSGYFQQPSSSTYNVDYAAILAWIKNGPQVLPPSLCAGRVRYYSTIPTTIPASGLSLDQLFWKKYIDYVLGIATSNLAGKTLYGKETAAWGTMRITPKSSLIGSPQPYMHYNDNPIRPRAHFWFGPLTMMMFLTADNESGNTVDNMWAGTLHESQCWQLKAGVNSALDDIRVNHPNDWASLIFFSNISGYSTPRVQLSRNYTKMKNALFFPFSLLDQLGDATKEIRPYDSSWNYTGDAEIPNARGGTCPHMGFMLAYNEFSGASGYYGRRGASKVCVFETDGVPNHHCSGTFSNSGAYNSKYTGSIGTTTSDGNNASAATDPAVAVVSQICALDNAASPGYSTSRSPARVHAIAFGDLFESSSTLKPQALDFLLRVQKAGNTSANTDTSIESYKIVIGTSDARIDNLRQALERIMQSGIQVSLIK
ncbi:MAG: pilus assembly protein TadG-related protein [Gemmataceae bacterium]